MTTATLIDGTVVDSSSEEWRLECEARHIAWHSSADIREYLDIVERKRGQEAARQLRNIVLKIREGQR